MSAPKFLLSITMRNHRPHFDYRQDPSTERVRPQLPDKSDGNTNQAKQWSPRSSGCSTMQPTCCPRTSFISRGCPVQVLLNALNDYAGPSEKQIHGCAKIKTSQV